MAHRLHSIIKRITIALALLAAFAVSADAQPRATQHRFGDDVYAAARDARVTGDNIVDVFAIGRAVTVDAQVKETVHAAGNRVRVDGQIGQDLYAAGYNVDIESRIGGDVTAAGYRIELGANATVAKNLRAAGRYVTVRGPVSGNALLAGTDVEIAAPITGSVEIRARTIRFSPGAAIGGELIYTARQPVTVPAGVIDPARVKGTVIPGPSVASIIATVLIVLVIVLASTFVLALIFAALFKRTLTRTREVMSTHPWRNLLLGLLVTGGLFGSVAVLAVSLIGIPLIPLVVILIPFAILAGYFTTAHAIGSRLLKRAHENTSALAAFGAIALGLLVLLLLQLIPILGWVISVLAVIIGLGALFAMWLAPRVAQPA